MRINVPCIYVGEFYRCNHPKAKKFLGLFKRSCIWMDNGKCNLREMPKRPPAPPSPLILEDATELLKTAKKIAKILKG